MTGDDCSTRAGCSRRSSATTFLVLIGGVARVIRGTDEITDGVDICPSVRVDNLERLSKALEELDARRADRRRLSLDEEMLVGESVVRLRTPGGELNLVAEPVGTRRGSTTSVVARRGSTSVRGCGRGLLRSPIWRGCRLRSRTSGGRRAGERLNGGGCARSSDRGSCGGSWRLRSGSSGHSGSRATSASTGDQSSTPRARLRSRPSSVLRSRARSRCGRGCSGGARAPALCRTQLACEPV